MRRIALLLLAAASPLLAQTPAPAVSAKPDFSGKWTLDVAQSTSDAMAPSSASITVTQTDKTMKLDQSTVTQMGTQNVTLTYNLDGTPAKNNVTVNGMSLELTNTAVWDGDVLVVTTSVPVQGQTYTTVDRWTRDASGKTVTVMSEVSFGGQTVTRKQVFKKE